MELSTLFLKHDRELILHTGLRNKETGSYNTKYLIASLTQTRIRVYLILDPNFDVQYCKLKEH
jgi:hypothetical protein